jgi:hypothetical protein
MAVRSAILTLAILLTTAITAAQRAETSVRGSTPSQIRVAVDALQAAAAAARANAPDALLLKADWLHDSVFPPPDWDGPRTNADDVTADYTQSLQRAAELIRNNPSPDVLADIAADLETKVEHCQRLGIGMGGVISVRVNTLRGCEAVINLQVSYMISF